jgi:hypothetical protein
MGPRLALGPWWTCDHGVARLLQGSGGHRDSSERERRPSGGSHQWEGCRDDGTSMTPVTRDENGEGETMGCGHFWRGRGGGGEAAPWYRRQTTQQRAV